MTYISSRSRSNSSFLNSIGSYAGQSNFLRIGERMFSDRNIRMLLMPLLALGFLFTIGNAWGQGVFGGKVAVMDAGSSAIWYNMNSQTCDGAGTGNLSSASGITTLNAYLGDKYFMGGNVRLMIGNNLQTERVFIEK